MALDMKALVKALSDSDLIITNPLNEWLLTKGDTAYDQEIIDFVAEQLGTTPRDRTQSFSASSATRCLREQQLQFLGMPSYGAIDPQLQNIFNDGKWRHLRWQAMLMQAGILDRGEVPLFWRNKRLRGTADGQGYVPMDHPRKQWRGKKWGFELKGMNPFQYDRIVNHDEKYKVEHAGQVHDYFLMGDFDLFVIVYENKATQAWKEWVFEPSEELLSQQKKELKKLNEGIDNKQLAPMLPSCKIRRGKWKTCPFAGDGGSCIRSGDYPVLKQGKKRKK